MRHQRLIVLATASILVASAGSAAALVTSRRAAPPAATNSAPTPTRASSSTTVQAQPAVTSTTSPRQVAGTRSTPATSPPRISDPARAADHLYQAWRDGDRRRARQFASAAAVDAMFATQPWAAVLPLQFSAGRLRLRLRLHQPWRVP